MRARSRNKKRNKKEQKINWCCCVTAAPRKQALSSSIIISKRANETFCAAKCLRDAARAFCQRRNCKLRIKSRTALEQWRRLSHFCFSLAPTHQFKRPCLCRERAAAFMRVLHGWYCARCLLICDYVLSAPLQNWILSFRNKSTLLHRHLAYWPFNCIINITPETLDGCHCLSAGLFMWCKRLRFQHKIFSQNVPIVFLIINSSLSNYILYHLTIAVHVTLPL